MTLFVIFFTASWDESKSKSVTKSRGLRRLDSNVLQFELYELEKQISRRADGADRSITNYA